MRRLAGAGLCAMTLVLAGCDSVEERVVKHYENAVEFAEAGQTEKAEIEFRNALKLDREYVPAHLGYAKLLEARGDLPAAVTHYRTAAELDTKNTEARVRITQYLILANQLNAALELAEETMEIAPDDVNVLAVRASVAYQLGNRVQAVELARKALVRDPDHPGANVILITDRVDAGETEDALAMSNNMIEKHPEEIAIHFLKLRLLADVGRDAELTEHLHAMTRVFPDVPQIRSTLAQRYVAKGDYAAGEEQLRAIAANDPDDAAHELRVAQFIGRTQGEAAARAELERLVKSEEDPWPFIQALASLDIAKGDLAAARARMRAIADGGGSHALEAQVSIARLAIREGDVDAAVTLVDEVLATDADNVDALAMRGAMQIESGAFEEAILTLRRALGEAPQDVRLLELSAQAFLLNGNNSLAGEQLAQATRASDYRPATALRYARFLLSSNNLQGAETVLTETARRAPGNQQVLSSLADLRLRLGDFVGAETVAAQLRQLQGGGSTAERVIAASLSAQERFDESTAILRTLVEDESTREQTMAAYVRDLVRGEKTDEALEFVQNILADNPENVQARVLLAALYRSSGETEKARTEYDRLIADNPEEPSGYGGLFRLQLGTGDTAAAFATLEEGVEKTKGATALRLLLAGMQETRGDYDDAIAQYEQLFIDRPDSLIVANNLASLLAEYRADDPASVERARNIARRLRSSQIPQMQDTFGWTLYLSGDYENALRSLKPAVDALPESAAVNYHVGMTYAALGQKELAITHLKRARDLAAADKFAHLDIVERKLSELETN
ncbi:MAG: tetratricopeptide repeat protein [Pseudomonadota bacterium]